ncbi:MAG: hypothetical protein J1G02_00490 [Clostridiales bacterium]|nr:hypothetical protein [Clostridiales bacterium]
MFFCKKIRPITAKQRKITLDLNFNKTKGEFVNQRNVALNGTGLSSTFALTKMPFYFKVDQAFRFYGDKLYLLAEHGVFGYLDDDYAYRLANNTYKTISHVIYQDALVFSCSTGTYSTVDGVESNKMTSAYFTCLEVYGDRIFGINGKQLYMTKAGDIRRWDETVNITAHSELDALVALDKLYILGDTCYTLKADGLDYNMKFEPFGYNVGKVQTFSVAKLGKRAIFASTNGLYEVKNNTLSAIFTQLNDFVSFDGAVACVHNGKYYIACKRKDGDQLVNDILLELDVDSNRIVAVLDAKVENICSTDGKIYAVIGNMLYVNTDEPTVSCYCKTVDFKTSDVKYLDRLIVRTKSDLEVWIDNGTENRRYKVCGKNTTQRLPITGAGRQFTVSVQSQGNMQLDSMELSARTYEV